MDHINEQAERGRFEILARAEKYNLIKATDGEYAFPAARGAWWGYLAARRAPAAQGEAVAYEVVCIGARGTFVQDVKRIVPGVDWRADHCHLGEYWAGNNPLYRAAPAPASAQGVFDAEWQAFTATRLRVLLRQVGVADPFPDSDADLLGVAGTVLGQIRAALAQPASQSGDGVKTPIPMQAIKKILTEVMEVAGANGADSRSMPDEYVAVAHFACYPEEYAHPTKEPQ